MGIISDLFGGGDKGFDAARQANEQNRGLYDQIALPNYQEWNPELYSPESSQYTLVSDDPVTKSAQLSALEKMSGLADTGLSDADMAGYTKAANQASQIARSGNAAALNNAQARGVGGSGLEFIMREQANQDAAQRAQDAGLQVAADSAKQKALYNQAFLQGTSNMRDQDYRTNQANSSIINNFNQANTNARNTASQYNATQKNDAFKYNQGLKDKEYQNQVGIADRKAGFNNRNAEITSAEDEARRKKNAAYGSLIGAAAGYGFAPEGQQWQGAQAGAGVGQAIY